ncbi:MAG: lysophospholipid acyltransferase family protein [Methylacidiphilales bacterium]|nr:lysophospholipid acyltransferase family protein [Candidatus Methylacidiphilales bacterium]
MNISFLIIFASLVRTLPDFFLLPILRIIRTLLISLHTIRPIKFISQIQKNISIFFSNKSSIQQRELLCNNVLHSLYTIPECMDAWKKRKETANNASLTGTELLKKSVERGKGTIVVAFHTANLEIGFYILNSLYPSYCTYQINNNRTIADAQYSYRKGYALGAIQSHQLKTIISLLKQNQICWIAPDQGKHTKHGIVSASFFNISIPTLTIVSRLATFTKSTVLIMLCGRNNQCMRKHEVSFHWYGTGDTISHNLLDEANRLNTFLEMQVNAYPDQYLWSYRIVK